MNRVGHEHENGQGLMSIVQQHLIHCFVYHAFCHSDRPCTSDVSHRCQSNTSYHLWQVACQQYLVWSLNRWACTNVLTRSAKEQIITLAFIKHLAFFTCCRYGVLTPDEHMIRKTP